MVARSGNPITDNTQSFVNDDQGHVARNVQIGGGNVTPGGVRNAIRNSVIQITDSATAIPITALSPRNSYTLHNKSDEDTIYIGNSDVTADTVVGSNTSGYELDPGSRLNVDIAETVTLYGRCESGKSAILKVMELG